MKRRTPIALTVAALGLGVALFLLTGAGDRVVRAVTGDTLPGHRNVAAEASPDSASEMDADVPARMQSRLLPPAATTQPLPPIDAALDSILPELERRVQAGDSRAACRLSFELLGCVAMMSENGENHRQRLASGEEQATKRGDAAAANRYAQRQLDFLQRQQACSRVPEATLAQAEDLLVQAARAGVPHAMLAYARGHAFPEGPLGQAPLHHELFDPWRREAPAMVERLAQAGNVAAISMMQQGYLGDQYLFES